MHHGLTLLTSFTTMSKPIAAARIPHSWDEQIRAIAKALTCQFATETGRTPSDVVKEAIGLYLEKTDPRSVASMNQRLKALEQRYKKLTQLI